MIENPANMFEALQNETAARIMTATIFQNLQMPDGTPWEVRTEDEGVVEEIFRQYIDACGLSVIVRSPTGAFNKDFRLTDNGPRLSPLEFDISIGEAVLFNRNFGTKIRIMSAVQAVLQMIKNWTPPSINIAIYPLRLVKDETQLLPDGTTVVVKRRIECEIPGVPLGPADIASP
jgi:hypothetical protein